MLSDPVNSGSFAAISPTTPGLTTTPLDVPSSYPHVSPSLRWRRTASAVTICAPRARHLLQALAGVLITACALAFISYRLASLPDTRNTAQLVGACILLVLPCAFGLMALFTLLPLLCPPRLKVDATGGVTLLLPSGFRLVRCRLPAGTFDLRTHQWVKGGPRRLATLFLRDRRTRRTYPIFHKYPAGELAEIVRALRSAVAS